MTTQIKMKDIKKIVSGILSQLKLEQILMFGFVGVLAFMVLNPRKGVCSPITEVAAIENPGGVEYDKIETFDADEEDMRKRSVDKEDWPSGVDYDPFEKSDSSSNKMVSSDLGNGKTIHFVQNKTSSFSKSAIQASAVGDNSEILIVDKHFNANGSSGNGSGFMMLANDDGKKFAALLNSEYRAIYDEEGWQYNHPNLISTSRQHRLGMLNQSRKRGIAAVIDEFAYRNDPVNGNKPIEWMQTVKGQRRIALANYSAMHQSEFKHIVCFNGHWASSSRGTGGTTYNGWHENVYSNLVHNNMNELTAWPWEKVQALLKQDLPTAPSFDPIKPEGPIIGGDKSSYMTGATDIPRPPEKKQTLMERLENPPTTVVENSSPTEIAAYKLPERPELPERSWKGNDEAREEKTKVKPVTKKKSSGPGCKTSN